MTAEKLGKAADRLAAACGRLRFAPPVTHVYNPLVYAREPFGRYLERFARPCRVLFLGMNPGPYGMAQTGIPFGEVTAAREWLRCEAPVGRPRHEHPARPIQGFACTRSEVSGRRLWALFRERFAAPDAFFAGHFVDNYCPLVFMEESGRNRTPDKLPRAERDGLYRVCDRHLQEVAAILTPEWVIGIGAFATARIREALPGVKSGTLLHPSPASPRANAGWAAEAARQLRALGLPGW